MTVCFQTTIELTAERIQKFCQSASWKLIGAYMQRTGRLHPAIDVRESIERDTTVFMDRAPYAR